MTDLAQLYPWVEQPLVASAPMRLIALAELTAATSLAGGIGFIGAGSDISDLARTIDETQAIISRSGRTLRTRTGSTLPFGIGLLLWGLDVADVLPIISDAARRPAAVWLFAPRQTEDLARWSSAIREATGGATDIWVQVGTVAEALEVVAAASPDVLVVQGQDAGGHGLMRGAGLLPLVPEVREALADPVREGNSRPTPALVAAGGIMESSGLAAALVLGAKGVVLGTRLLVAREANLAPGYREAVARANDGGTNTVRSHVYDTLRGTTDWPARYGGRGVVNASFIDHEAGMDVHENKRLYEKALQHGDAGWGGQSARLTTYAGTGVGLASVVQPASEIVREVRQGASAILRRTLESLDAGVS